MNSTTQYMVEFDIKYADVETFMTLIPEQRKIVDLYFLDGSLLSYSLNMNRSKLWAVFSVDTENKLLLLIDGLPLTQFMDYNYHELMFHNGLHMIPSISLN